MRGNDAYFNQAGFLATAIADTPKIAARWFRFADEGREQGAAGFR